jgi:hypothetical protein
MVPDAPARVPEMLDTPPSRLIDFYRKEALIYSVSFLHAKTSD